MDAIAGGDDGALTAMTTAGIIASTRSKARMPASTLTMTLPQGSLSTTRRLSARPSASPDADGLAAAAQLLLALVLQPLEEAGGLSR